MLDPALMRPGRLDRKIEIPLPNEQARMEILKIHAANITKHGDIDYEAVVKLAEGFNGADLRNVSGRPCADSHLLSIIVVAFDKLAEGFNSSNLRNASPASEQIKMCSSGTLVLNPPPGRRGYLILLWTSRAAFCNHADLRSSSRDLLLCVDLAARPCAVAV